MEAHSQGSAKKYRVIELGGKSDDLQIFVEFKKPRQEMAKRDQKGH